MEFEDLTREQLEKYAKDDGLLTQMLFLHHPSLVVELLGDIGTAKKTADIIRERTEMADAAEVIGLLQKHPEHAESEEAIINAIAGVDLAFEAVLNAVELLNYVAKNCRCINCQRRRGIKNVETN